VQQVQLKVIIAEASRSAVRALGINAVVGGGSAFGGVTIGPENGGPINPVSIGVPQGSGIHPIPFNFTQPTNVSPAATLFAGIPSADLAVFVQALAENQYVRLLAEPTLVALSGQDANFLAGGEFPIPVVQGGSGAGGTSISVEYKEFGVRLKFKPMVLGDGSIRLHVAPEVSEISNGPGAVQIQGFNIPALLSRRAETTLELKSGQSFAMAGLISQTTEARNSRVPGMGDLPILGPLFRSVRYQHGDTELLVLVTATLVEPSSSTGQPLLPGADHVRPSDWELYLQGRIEGRASPSPPRLSPADAQSMKDIGLDRLKGPGAWANYETGPANSSAPFSPPPTTTTTTPTTDLKPSGAR
jgi:pilus assembly protein CpaC